MYDSSYDDDRVARVLSVNTFALFLNDMISEAFPTHIFPLNDFRETLHKYIILEKSETCKIIKRRRGDEN